MRYDGLIWRRQHKVGYRRSETPYVEFYNRTTGETIDVEHSKTNMAFENNTGRGYLVIDGKVYTSAPKKLG